MQILLELNDEQDLKLLSPLLKRLGINYRNVKENKEDAPKQKSQFLLNTTEFLMNLRT